MSRSSVGAGVLLALLATACQPSTPTTEFSSTAAAATSATCHARHVDEANPQAWLPDPQCTPGKANPAVTIGQLCPHVAAYLKRPDTDYTNSLKARQLAAYDYVDSAGSHPQTMKGTEEDHLIARSLGGDLSAPDNLWPEPHASINDKDRVEAAAHAALCRGAMSLPQVQQGMATNWVALGKRLGVKFSTGGRNE